MGRMASGDFDTADRLHSAAIHLLRRLRREDPATGLAPARLSALSVLVFGGPMNLTALAAAEQVQPPTMTRVVQALEGAGLVRRKADATDKRGTTLMATARGRRILEEGRRRRVLRLAEELRALPSREREVLESAAAILERLGGGSPRLGGGSKGPAGGSQSRGGGRRTRTPL
ncbi:MAG TPA: MarR family transcriptional regulator [Vicinamibacterales bacterium]